MKRLKIVGLVIMMIVVFFIFSTMASAVATQVGEHIVTGAPQEGVVLLADVSNGSVLMDNASQEVSVQNGDIVWVYQLSDDGLFALIDTPESTPDHMVQGWIVSQFLNAYQSATATTLPSGQNATPTATLQPTTIVPTATPAPTQGIPTPLPINQLPIELDLDIWFQQPVADCDSEANREDFNTTCSTAGEYRAGQFTLDPGEAVVFTGDQIFVQYYDESHTVDSWQNVDEVLVSEIGLNSPEFLETQWVAVSPRLEERTHVAHDVWVLLNQSNAPILMSAILPFGGYRGFFSLPLGMTWTPDRIGYLRDLHLNMFLTEILNNPAENAEFAPTAVPNCINREQVFDDCVGVNTYTGSWNGSIWDIATGGYVNLAADEFAQNPSTVPYWVPITVSTPAAPAG